MEKIMDFENVDFCWKAASGKYFIQKRIWIGLGYQVVHYEISEDVYFAWEVYA